MSREHTYPMNLAVPNLLNICIDEEHDGLIAGRMYHYYSTEPAPFQSLLELMKLAEKLFDSISFPQASTKARSFAGLSTPEPPYNTKRPERKISAAELAAQRGKLATLLTRVEYRQRSTWQGETLWIEGHKKEVFSTEVELTKILKDALGKMDV